MTAAQVANGFIADGKLKTMKRIRPKIVFACALILLSLTAGLVKTQDVGAKMNASQISAMDRSKIVDLALRQLVADRVRFNISFDQSVSSDNLVQVNLPGIEGYKFTIDEPANFRIRAERSGTADYLSFDFTPVKVTNDQVKMRLCHVFIGTCFGRTIFQSCSTGLYRKVNDSWTGELQPPMRVDKLNYQLGIAEGNYNKF